MLAVNIEYCIYVWYKFVYRCQIRGVLSDIIQTAQKQAQS